jgi:hypothetical protein
VAVIPAEHTRIIVGAELEGAASWAERHGVRIEWMPEDLELRVTLLQPEKELLFFLRGTFEDYRALPPEWTFGDEKWEGVGRPADFPKGAQSPFGGSIFIMHNQTAVICVPFNRLAYVDHAGPHGDWSGPANWLNAGPSHIHADTIGDMLQALYRDFLLTRERMANP